MKSEFDLKIVENEDLFSHIEEAKISDFLSEILKQNVPLALAIDAEDYYIKTPGKIVGIFTHMITQSS